MYKNLIVGLALIFATFSGFYMIRAGGGELVRNAFIGEPEQMTLNSPTPESVAGIYKCNIKTGCKDKYVIMLREDQTIEFLSASNPADDTEFKEEIVTEGVDTEEPKPVERSRIVFLDENTTAEDLTITTSVDSTTSSTTDASSTEIVRGESAVQSAPMQAEGEQGDIPENISSLTELEEASKAVVERGTWAFGGGNILIITLNKLGDTEYESPQKLVIKHIGASTLSGITFDRGRYKEMVKPVFIKVE